MENSTGVEWKTQAGHLGLRPVMCDSRHASHDLPESLRCLAVFGIGAGPLLPCVVAKEVSLPMTWVNLIESLVRQQLL